MFRTEQGFERLTGDEALGGGLGSLIGVMSYGVASPDIPHKPGSAEAIDILGGFALAGTVLGVAVASLLRRRRDHRQAQHQAEQQTAIEQEQRLQAIELDETEIEQGLQKLEVYAYSSNLRRGINSQR